MEGYVGIDISKLRLDVDLQGSPYEVSNDAKGIRKLTKKLKNLHTQEKLILVICEASGGYEAPLVTACHEQDLPIHVAHANKVRSFAKSTGLLAKTDQLDAKVLSRYGCLLKPQADTLQLSKNAEKIRSLLKRREQLQKDKKGESNRLDKLTDVDIKHSIKAHIKWLNGEIKKIESALDQQCQAEEIKTKHDLLTSVPAIGSLSAYYLIAYLPELGTLNHKPLTALVGVVPYNRDSGSFNGKRYIQGGRGVLRHLLYMAAVTAIRCNPDLSVFYKRLRDAGKPAKVALVAVIRKLLTIVNSVMHRQTPWVETLANNADFS